MSTEYHVTLKDAELGLLISLLQADCLPGGVHKEPSTYEVIVTGEKADSIQLMWKLIHVRTGTHNSEGRT